MKNVKNIVLYIGLIFLAGFFFAQNKLEENQKKQKQLEKEITDIQEILKNTDTESEVSLGKIHALNELVYKRRLYIDELQNEVTKLETNLNNSEELITALQNDVDSIKTGYAEMIYATSKMNHSFNRLFLIFSSKSYNHLALRLKFLNQFTEIKKEQVIKIGKVHDALGEERSIIAKKYIKKKKALDKILLEKEKLSKEIKAVQKERSTLLNKQQELRKRLKKKKKENQRIKDNIKDLMKGPTDYNLSKTFAANKGKLPWPVRAKKFISWRHGIHPHPTIDNVEVNNLGMGIQTTKSTPVYASFEGEVRRVMSIPGSGKTIMVKHGEYFTVYGRLKNVTVKRGQKISTGQKIGEVLAVEGTNTVDFQVWKKQNNLNPQKWLVK